MIVAGLVAVLLASQPVRLDHRAHLETHGVQGCAACHVASTDADRSRPGQLDHHGCDGRGCHVEDFYGVKSSETMVCRVCHPSGTLFVDKDQLWPFPNTKPDKDDGRRQYLDGLDFYAEFDHRRHLRAGGPMSQVEDDHCMHCHQIEPTTLAAVRASHATCAPCHENNAEAPMSACTSCHRYRRDNKGRAVATGPSMRAKQGRVTRKFSHENHRTDRRAGKGDAQLSCGMCHSKAARATTLGAIEPTNGMKTMVQACGKCHRAGQRTKDGRAMFTITGKCTYCHEKRFLDGERLPREHR